MLGPKPDPDQPCRYPTQKRETGKEADGTRRRELDYAFKDTRYDAVLNEHLHSLSDAGRPFSSMLHEAQILACKPPSEQCLGKQIGSGDSILDSQVDANSADRGHRVGSIADAEEAVAIPVPAEVAQKVGVLLQDENVDAGAGQQQPKHDSCRTAASNAAAYRHLIRCHICSSRFPPWIS